ncbi:MAG: hypothetical protein VB126_12725 [Paludibacter sp.]|nr:hypothetical protein [Paludibacter sp.]
MNSVSNRWAVTFTCLILLIVQNVLVDHISAQELVTIRGFVLDEITKIPVPNATINLPENRITVAEFDGKFEFSCLREDTFMITAIGYCPRLLSVHDLLADSSMCNVFMQPVTYQLRAVQVEAEKRQTKVLKALNLIADLSHPITYFSKEQIVKRRFVKLESNSIFLSQNIYWEINRRLIEKISRLQAEDLDKCIMYCNTHIVLSPKDDERTITNKLLLLISDYFRSSRSEN